MVFVNRGEESAHVSVSSPEPAGSPFEPRRSAPFAVPPRGRAILVVAFAPREIASFAARLTLVVDGAAAGAIALNGRAGEPSPRIGVEPAQIDFGSVALGTVQHRRLTVANVGVDIGGTCADALGFGRMESSSSGECHVADETLPELVTDHPDELSIDIDWAPESHPRVPLCSYEVLPQDVRFGNVGEGRTLAFGFHVRNTSEDAVECVLTSVEFAPGAPIGLSARLLATLPVAIPAGEMRVIDVAITYPPTTPDLAFPLVAEVDGVPYPAVGPSAEVRWGYDSTAHSVDFDPLAAPEPGMTVTVTYLLPCP